jgi:hypothetical protein
LVDCGTDPAFEVAQGDNLGDLICREVGKAEVCKTTLLIEVVQRFQGLWEWCAAVL